MSSNPIISRLPLLGHQAEALTVQLLSCLSSRSLQEKEKKTTHVSVFWVAKAENEMK